MIILIMIDDLVTKPARTNASGSGPNCRRQKASVKTTVRPTLTAERAAVWRSASECVMISLVMAPPP
ncbi:hypothetical protein [Bradyrhizobium sp. RDI18]|uniref:hypothetical protein n=1 Tax=Bradyrhizobium sp. RDI18 TaxID=3367400 RepID=UPI003710F895